MEGFKIENIQGSEDGVNLDVATDSVELMLEILSKIDDIIIQTLQIGRWTRSTNRRIRAVQHKVGIVQVLVPYATSVRVSLIRDLAPHAPKHSDVWKRQMEVQRLGLQVFCETENLVESLRWKHTLDRKIQILGRLRKLRDSILELYWCTSSLYVVLAISRV